MSVEQLRSFRQDVNFIVQNTEPSSQLFRSIYDRLVLASQATKVKCEKWREDFEFIMHQMENEGKS